MNATRQSTLRRSQSAVTDVLAPPVDPVTRLDHAGSWSVENDASHREIPRLNYLLHARVSGVPRIHSHNEASFRDAISMAVQPLKVLIASATNGSRNERHARRHSVSLRSAAQPWRRALTTWLCMFVVLAVPRPLFASDINFTVAGTVPAVRQPSGNTCWAAAATIMVSWKTQTSLDVADVAKRAGPKFETRFKNDERLPFGETAAFLSSLGIKAEEPQNFSVAAWLELLKTHGPLWVGTNEGSAGEFLAHARIIEGIFGDGSPGGTFFRIVDPSDGSRTNDETVSSFVRKFEDIAKRENRAGRDLRPQVVHY